MAHYRVKEHRQFFTPQRKVLGFWRSIGAPQPTMEAANAIIRERRRKKREEQGKPVKPESVKG